MLPTQVQLHVAADCTDFYAKNKAHHYIHIFGRNISKASNQSNNPQPEINLDRVIGWMLPQYQVNLMQFWMVFNLQSLGHIHQQTDDSSYEQGKFKVVHGYLLWMGQFIGIKLSFQFLYCLDQCGQQIIRRSIELVRVMVFYKIHLRRIEFITGSN